MIEKGRSKIRKDFKNQLENIGSMGGDIKVQRYVKILPSFYLINRIKITEANFDAIRFALLQIFIIKAFAVANPVSLFVEDQQGNKNHIDHPCIGNRSCHR